jgi:uncharacterized OsmC-like protein
MLLQALVACAGVTMRSVATAMGLSVDGTIHAEGDLDWRGTLAVDKGAPVGFKGIRLRFELESGASDEELATLQRLTERYCVVFQTLASSPSLSVSLERSSAAAGGGRSRLLADLRRGQDRDWAELAGCAGALAALPRLLRGDSSDQGRCG